MLGSARRRSRSRSRPAGGATPAVRVVARRERGAVRIGIGSNCGDPANVGGRSLALGRRAGNGAPGALSDAGVGRPGSPTSSMPRPRRDAARPARAARGAQGARGRPRPHGSFRWGPRAIDLGYPRLRRLRLDDPGLTIPHARLFERAFALGPLAEIDPASRLPLRRCRKPSGRRSSGYRLRKLEAERLCIGTRRWNACARLRSSALPPDSRASASRKRTWKSRYGARAGVPGPVPALPSNRRPPANHRRPAIPATVRCRTTSGRKPC